MIGVWWCGGNLYVIGLFMNWEVCWDTIGQLEDQFDMINQALSQRRMIS